jgi:hypothetical protein
MRYRFIHILLSNQKINLLEISPYPGGREAVKKSLKASRLGGDVVEVLQRHLMTSSRRDVKTLIVWPAYDVLLPLFSQMIRNCKTLKIPLPDLLLNFFTA